MPASAHPATAAAATADRPDVPRDYGVPRTTKGLLDWAPIEQRLATARVYWVATAGADRQPRVRPVDGLFVDGILYVGGSPKTRWVRDIAENRLVSVHLDGLDDVVILEGEAEVLAGSTPELARRLAAASNAKYPEYGMTEASYRGPGPIAIRFRQAFAWSKFPRDVTRFRFGSTPSAEARSRSA
jgi:nitroimidazol reductase NimA-like FMN-containing flavoprotein (pyridoxamine 5'-phosphate oxidase superfamily)